MAVPRPREGVCVGAKSFGSDLLQTARGVCVSLSFYHSQLRCIFVLHKRDYSHSGGSKEVLGPRPPICPQRKRSPRRYRNRCICYGITTGASREVMHLLHRHAVVVGRRYPKVFVHAIQVTSGLVLSRKRTDGFDMDCMQLGSPPNCQFVLCLLVCWHGPSTAPRAGIPRTVSTLMFAYDSVDCHGTAKNRQTAERTGD